MPKSATRKARASRRLREWDEEGQVVQLHEPRRHENPLVKRTDFECQTETQTQYRVAIDSHKLIFGTGPAGTGKTYIATCCACKKLIDKEISRIVVTRPAINAEEEIGFLPGELAEKWAPYFRPLRDIFTQWFSESHLENMLKRNVIEIAPMGFIRGRTFDNAFVILDEAQNTTMGQMKLFLTRIGEYSTVVVNGDVSQKDIKGKSGLDDALERFDGMKACQVIEFTEKDIVRSGLVREILKRYMVR